MGHPTTTSLGKQTVPIKSWWKLGFQYHMKIGTGGSKPRLVEDGRPRYVNPHRICWTHRDFNFFQLISTQLSAAVKKGWAVVFTDGGHSSDLASTGDACWALN